MFVRYVFGVVCMPGFVYVFMRMFVYVFVCVFISAASDGAVSIQSLLSSFTYSLCGFDSAYSYELVIAFPCPIQS